MSSGEPRRGVGVVMRVRPTASYAHGSLMIDTDRATVELKLDASHDEVVNNQVTLRAHSTTTLACSLRRRPCKSCGHMELGDGADVLYPARSRPVQREF